MDRKDPFDFPDRFTDRYIYERHELSERRKRRKYAGIKPKIDVPEYLLDPEKAKAKAPSDVARERKSHERKIMLLGDHMMRKAKE